MVLSPTPLVELELVKGSGSWTDITSWVDISAGISTKFGRTTPWGDAQPATLSLTLDNTDGRFTPDAQYLADGVTTHPYWPNLRPGRRIRFSGVTGAGRQSRFTGFVKGWPPGFKDTVRPRITIDAQDVLARLSRLSMQSAIAHEILFDDPSIYWPLTDDSGAVSAQASVGDVPLLLTGNTAGTDPIQFGSNGPGAGDGPGIACAPTGQHTGQMLVARNTQIGAVQALVIEAWVNPGTTLPAWASTAGYMNALVVDDNLGNLAIQLGVDGSGHAFASTTAGTGTITGPSLLDGGWHHLMLSLFPGAGGSPIVATFRVDLGDAIAIATSLPLSMTPAYVSIGDWAPIPRVATRSSSWQGGIGQVALYGYPSWSSGGEPLATGGQTRHYNAGIGWAGETVDQRIERYLGYAGLTATSYSIDRGWGTRNGSVDMELDASTVVLGSYAQAGQTVLQGCLDAVHSEGGPAVLYADPDGLVQFLGRNSRPQTGSASASVATIDAGNDLAGATWQPAYTLDDIVNFYDVSRQTESGGQWSTVVQDAASVAEFGKFGDSVTSTAQSNDDVQRVAEDRLARTRQPQYRVGQLGVDLATTTTSGLATALLGNPHAAGPMSAKVTVAALPSSTGAAQARDLYVEGWGESVNDQQWLLTCDTTPADQLIDLIYDDATYGRWQADGQTLNTAITASSTTVVIATVAGEPTFTTNASMYPLTIQVGEEHIQLNSAPGGSSSPQTFTGVTRGAGGTQAAAQAAGAEVELAPELTWAL